MIKIKDLEKAKQSFKSTFNKDVTGTLCVQIKGKENILRIAGHDRFNNLREIRIEIETDAWSNGKNITLSSVDKLDVVWDFLWNRDGFWLECYPNNYTGLKITNEYGTEYTMAGVVFNTKRKRYLYTAPQCDSIKVIED